jgi:hypothetical protein
MGREVEKKRVRKTENFICKSLQATRGKYPLETLHSLVCIISDSNSIVAESIFLCMLFLV